AREHLHPERLGLGLAGLADHRARDPLVVVEQAREYAAHERGTARDAQRRRDVPPGQASELADRLAVDGRAQAVSAPGAPGFDRLVDRHGGRSSSLTVGIAATGYPDRAAALGGGFGA